MLKENKDTGLKKVMLPILVLIIFSFLTRFLYLGRVPTGITNDELDHVMDAKAIFYTGKGFTGTWTPFSLLPPPHGNPKGELPGLVIAPLIGPLPTNLFVAHLPFAIAGLLLVLVVYFIALRFFNSFLAFIIALIACFNPTLIMFSRSGYEASPVLILFFVAFYFLLFSKGKKILYSLPFLFFAFFMYIALKIIFLPLVFIACLYGWRVTNGKKYTRYYFLTLGFSVLLLGWYFYSLKFISTGAGSRLDELLTPFSPYVSQVVDQERRLSVVSPLISVFNNKLIIFGRLFVEKYLGIFSSSFLFLFGEGQMFFSLWKHGMFYYLDFFFMCLGFVYLFVRYRKEWLFLVGIILIAPIPAALSVVGNEYVVRASLFYVPLIFFIGAGVYYFLSLLKNGKVFYSAIFLLIFSYSFLIGNFFTIYHLRNPIYNSEGSGFSVRVLSSYLQRTSSKNKEVRVVVQENSGFFKNYLFYNQIFNKETISSLQKKVQERDFAINKVIFLDSCSMVKEINPNEIVVSLSLLDCFDAEDYPYWLSLPLLADGGEIFKIYNDSLCKNFELGTYPHDINYRHFAIENLSDEVFCQKFITDLTGYSRLAVVEEGK